MKKFLIVLIGGGDIFLTLIDAAKGAKIEGDNDKAIRYSEKGQGFDSFKELIDYVIANKIEITGEFEGYAY